MHPTLVVDWRQASVQITQVHTNRVFAHLEMKLCSKSPWVISKCWVLFVVGCAAHLQVEEVPAGARHVYETVSHLVERNIPYLSVTTDVCHD